MQMRSEPDNQNSVISFVLSQWLLPELSFSDRWSRGTKLWERDWYDNTLKFPFVLVTAEDASRWIYSYCNTKQGKGPRNEVEFNRLFATNDHKLRHAGGQAHYYSRTGTLKQRPVKLEWLRPLCVNVPVGQ